MPAYEIQWELNDQFRHCFEGQSLSEIENILRRHELILRDAEGNYCLASQIATLGLDSASIRAECLSILSSSHEIVGCDDLLQRLETEGVETENISVSILAALLRSDHSFEEIGTNRFRTAR